MNRIVNRHINHWFHSTQHDGGSPAITIQSLNDIFLQHLQRFGFHLWLSETEFRRNICRAICIMYMAAKRNETWHGPFSKAPRPDGWTDEDELEWFDHLHFNYFSYDFWQTVWSQIFPSFWESKVPYWRDSIERILIHYIAIDTTFMEEDPNQTEHAQQQHHHYDEE